MNQSILSHNPRRLACEITYVFQGFEIHVRDCSQGSSVRQRFLFSFTFTSSLEEEGEEEEILARDPTYPLPHLAPVCAISESIFPGCALQFALNIKYQVAEFAYRT